MYFTYKYGNQQDDKAAAKSIGGLEIYTFSCVIICIVWAQNLILKS